MPRIIINPVSVDASQKNFQVEFARVKDLLQRIAAVECGLQQVARNMRELHQLRLAKMNPDPMRESSSKLETMKNYLRLYSNEMSMHLDVLFAANSASAEQQQLQKFITDFANDLINRNTSKAWDQLYNFSALLKNLVTSFPKLAFIRNLRSTLIEPALDEYFEAKEAAEAKKSIDNELAEFNSSSQGSTSCDSDDEREVTSPSDLRKDVLLFAALEQASQQNLRHTKHRLW